MPAWIVTSVYGFAIAAAVALLYFFGMRSWYWHALSVLLAIVIGLVPPPVTWQGPGYDLTIGAVCLFLFLWGALSPLFMKRHRPHHKQPHHA